MELINGRTAEEIKRGLIACSRYYTSPDEECVGCPYGVKESPVCAINILMQDALVLIERLEAAQPMWISVEERLPEDGAKVAVIVEGRIMTKYYHENEPFSIVLLGKELGKVTHWMPLPEVPREGA